jgi:hypothetical protein
VTSSEQHENDFLLYGTEGGMPQLHGRFYHLQFDVLCIGQNGTMEEGPSIANESLA